MSGADEFNSTEAAPDGKRRIPAIVGVILAVLWTSLRHSSVKYPGSAKFVGLAVVAGLGVFAATKLFGAAPERPALRIMWGLFAGGMLVVTVLMASMMVTTAAWSRSYVMDQWSNDPVRAAHFAISLRRPLVVDFFQASCVYCSNLDRDSLHTLDIALNSDCCVFARADPAAMNSAGKAMFRRVILRSVPTVVVFRVLNSGPQETGRINGYQDGSSFYDHLSRLLKQAR